MNTLFVDDVNYFAFLSAIRRCRSYKDEDLNALESMKSLTVVEFLYDILPQGGNGAKAIYYELMLKLTSSMGTKRVVIEKWIASRKLSHLRSVECVYTSAFKQVKDNITYALRRQNEKVKIPTPLVPASMTKWVSVNEAVQPLLECLMEGKEFTDDRAPQDIYLAVPFTEKEQAKKRGARWNSVHKSWFLPKGKSMSEMLRWIRPNDRRFLNLEHSHLQRTVTVKPFEERIVMKPSLNFSLETLALDLATSNEEVSVTHVEVTPDMARYWISNFNYVHQRSLNTNRVDELVAQMLLDQFRDYTTISFAVLGDRPMLINGQHTLNAVQKSMKNQKLTVELILAKDMEKVGTLFATFDTQKKRTLQERLVGIGKELDLNTKEEKCFSHSVRELSRGLGIFGVKQISEIEARAQDAGFIANEMRNWSAEMNTYLGLLKQAQASNRDSYFRSLVTAVALITLRYQPAFAVEFWGQSVADDGLRVGNPAKTLNNWLKKNPVKTAQDLQHRAAIACWNAFYRGKQLTSVMTKTGLSERAMGCAQFYSAFDEMKSQAILSARRLRQSAASDSVDGEHHTGMSQ